MPGGMPRGEAHFKFYTPKPQHLPLVKINGGLRTWVNIEPKDRAASACPPQHMIVWMQCHQRQRIQCVGDGACSADMIEMRMRIPEMSDPPAAFLGLSQNDRTIPGRINHCGFFCFRVCDEIGVSLGWAQGEGKH